MKYAVFFHILSNNKTRLHFYLKNLSPVECLKNAVTFASYKIGESGGAKGFLTEPELKKTVKNLDFEIFTVRDRL